MAVPAWAAHPAFAPYRTWLGDADERPPDVAALCGFARERSLALPSGAPLVFAPERPANALAYERLVAERGVVATRPGVWHDAFNALAWLAFPRTKAALNAVHCRHGDGGTANRRGRARDAATLLDESGLLLASADPCVRRLLAAHAWRALFVERADMVAACVVAVVGHGLLDKLRRPFPSIAARALVLEVPADAEALRAPSCDALDAAAAEAIAAPAFGPDRLLPLPVAAWPGWDTQARGAERFDDLSVFRPKALRCAR